jgi:transcriptional regulator with XRE-family HTH domain
MPTTIISDTARFLPQWQALLRRVTPGDRPSFEEAREFLRTAGHCFAALLPESADEYETQAVQAVALLESLTAFALLRAGNVAASAAALAKAWNEASVTVLGRRTLRNPPVAGGRRVKVRISIDLITAFNAAYSLYMISRLAERRGAAAIRRLMAHLALSYDDVGRIAGVSGETIRRWDRGTVMIPAEKLGRLTAASAALDTFLTLFRPEALPEVIRRPAEAFGSERALDWILRGRIAEAAALYERELRYQA